jgi:hypothetical protein
VKTSSTGERLKICGLKIPSRNATAVRNPPFAFQQIKSRKLSFGRESARQKAAPAPEEVALYGAAL